MIDIDKTVLIQFVNFVISLFVLNLLLIRPVRDIIRKRAEKMAGLLEGAEAFAARADEKIKNYNAALEEARKAGALERGALREAGLAQEKQILEAAGADAAAKIAAERAAIGAEAGAAKNTLAGQVGALAQKVAAKVLG
jgi:F-type H+-transporting ATPase subunit b